MGRYSTEPVAPRASGAQGDWPTTFDKPIVGLDLNGTIVEDRTPRDPSAVSVIPNVLDAIRTIRKKRHRLIILSDQPEINEGVITPQNIDDSFQSLMKIFGEAGIQSIDGFLYNTSNHKSDEYAKPNTGMVERAERELIRDARFKNGWYVGDSFVDLKFADRMGAKPVLVKTGNYEEALEKLEKHTYRKLKNKTLVYDTLLDFANDL